MFCPEKANILEFLRIKRNDEMRPLTPSVDSHLQKLPQPLERGNREYPLEGYKNIIPSIREKLSKIFF